MKNIFIALKLRTILIAVGVIALNCGAAKLFLENCAHGYDCQQVLLFAAPACLAVQLGGAVFLANSRRSRVFGAGFLAGVVLTASSTLVSILTPQRIIIENASESIRQPRIDPGGLATQLWQRYLNALSSIPDYFALEFDENFAMPIAASLPHLIAGFSLGYLFQWISHIWRPKPVKVEGAGPLWKRYGLNSFFRRS